MYNHNSNRSHLGGTDFVPHTAQCILHKSSEFRPRQLHEVCVPILPLQMRSPRLRNQKSGLESVILAITHTAQLVTVIILTGFFFFSNAWGSWPDTEPGKCGKGGVGKPVLEIRQLQQAFFVGDAGSWEGATSNPGSFLKAEQLRGLKP